jgi:hypothetical protein
MLHRLGVDALDTGAWAILVVQLAHRLGWATWNAEDLDSALEVDQIARHSTSVKSACGVPSSGRTLSCSMFGSADSMVMLAKWVASLLALLHTSAHNLRDMCEKNGNMAWLFCRACVQRKGGNVRSASGLVWNQH